jgi:nucleoside-diphosphate-sugar epimerase
VRVSGKDIKIKYEPTRLVGLLSRTANITKAKALLSWEPRISLEEGLRHTYRIFSKAWQVSPPLYLWVIS